MAEKAKYNKKEATKKYIEKINRIQKKIIETKKGASTINTGIQKIWSNYNKRIKVLYNELKNEYRNYANNILPFEYLDSVKNELSQLRNTKIGKEKIEKIKIDNIKKLKIQAEDKRLKKIINSKYHKNAINSLINDTITITDSAVENDEKKIRMLIAEGMAEETEKISIENKLLNELRKKLLNKNTIKVNNRNYDAEYYAKLIARTQSREAQTNGVINTAISLGNDLVQVSSHNTQTAICMPYEAKVFSISGQDKDFPKLDIQPPFHRNCLHSISIIIREMLEYRGIQQYIDFANNKTNKPPYKDSYIPISERG